MSSPQPAGIDPRGPRFAAALTSVVLAAVLLSIEPATEVAAVLLSWQVVVFAVGALIGLRHTPYAHLFVRLVRPRLAAPGELEDPRPPRFAQAIGLAFTAVALVALVAGAETVALVAVAAALVAALLNAVVGLCLGCEMYLILRRFAPAQA